MCQQVFPMTVIEIIPLIDIATCYTSKNKAKPRNPTSLPSSYTNHILISTELALYHLQEQPVCRATHSKSIFCLFLPGVPGSDSPTRGGDVKSSSKSPSTWCSASVSAGRALEIFIPIRRLMDCSKSDP